MSVDKVLINLANRIEILERNASAAEEREARNMRSLKSCLYFCILGIELLGIFLRDREENFVKVTRDVLKKLNTSVEKLQIRMNTLEQNHKEMMQRYEGLVKEVQEDAVRNKREEMRNQEAEYRQLEECIRGLKDKLKSTKIFIQESVENKRKYKSPKEIKENVRNDSKEKHIEKNVRPTRRQAKANITHNQAIPANDETAIIEPSGSESKRPAVPPPPTAPVTQKRRLQKKKPFTPDDDSVVDIKPTVGYYLRSRKPRQ